MLGGVVLDVLADEVDALFAAVVVGEHDRARHAAGEDDGAASAEIAGQAVAAAVGPHAVDVVAAAGAGRHARAGPRVDRPPGPPEVPGADGGGPRVREVARGALAVDQAAQGHQGVAHLGVGGGGAGRRGSARAETDRREQRRAEDERASDHVRRDRPFHLPSVAAGTRLVNRAPRSWGGLLIRFAAGAAGPPAGVARLVRQGAAGGSEGPDPHGRRLHGRDDAQRAARGHRGSHAGGGAQGQGAAARPGRARPPARHLRLARRPSPPSTSATRSSSAATAAAAR